MNTEQPETLEEAVSEMITWSWVESWAKDPNTGEPTDKEEACASVHHSVGRSIRNNWGLWAESALARDIRARFRLAHADDMSGLLFHCLHCEINGLQWKPEDEAARYKEHWDAYSIWPEPLWEV